MKISGREVKDTDEDKKNRKQTLVNHVGGVNDELGGVDPMADENLVRLSGGP